MPKRKLRGGMLGGGIGAFIGAIHRIAASLDGEAEFVAGAFSSAPEKSKRSGKKLYFDPSRVYPHYQEMVRKESRRAKNERLDFVTIVTPNSSHFEMASAFLKAGFNVICDKPMTTTLAEAKKLKRLVKKNGKVFCLTHNYTGYSLVKQARYLVRKGVLGKINKIIVEYPQGWLSPLLAGREGGVSNWRLDPKVAGASCCLADIGTHAENLARYITGLTIDEVSAELSSFIPGNILDDDASILIRYRGGAKGVLLASQILSGEENGLNIRIYGSKAGLYWNQENPNYLAIKDPGGFTTTYSRGNPGLCPEARKAQRLPAGHPEGFIEGFANIYCEAFKAIKAEISGKKIPRTDYPTVEDGVIGMAFLETALKSARTMRKWTKLKDYKS